MKLQESEIVVRTASMERKWLEHGFLFYSVGALFGILPPKYLEHYMKLVAAIRTYKIKLNILFKSLKNYMGKVIWDTIFTQ